MFKGQELLTLPEPEMRRVRGNEITIVFQEPMTSLNPLHTIEKQIGETLLLHRGIAGPAARKRIIDLLDQVGIRDPESRLGSYPHQLSGGQRQRAMIAMALANEPDLLIADEPTTALDVTVQAQILKLLKDIQTRLGMSMLFITHDLGIVRKVADRVCVMKRGKIVEQGAVERVFVAPEHPYTRALLAAEPKPNPAPLQPDAPMVVETKDLKVWFPVKRGVLRKVVGHIKAVDGVSIEIRKGETLGVVGESGSGKTTLGLAILRLISSDGPIVFLGKQLQGLKFKQMRPFRRDMQIVFQDPFGSLSPRMSISDIIEEGLWVHQPKLSAAEREQRVIRALSDVGLDPESRFRYPHEYSGGQRQRIAVARTLVLEPTFIVLDEPTSALDMLIQSQMVDLLRDLQQAPGFDLSVHLARSARGGGARQPADRDAARQSRGDGCGVRCVRESANRVHSGSVRGGLQPRDGAGRRGGAIGSVDMAGVKDRATAGSPSVTARQCGRSRIIQRRRTSANPKSIGDGLPSLRTLPRRACACGRRQGALDARHFADRTHGRRHRRRSRSRRDRADPPVPPRRPFAMGLGDLVEIPAGYVDRDETPDDAMRRECEEEIGIAPRGLREICTFMPAPGILDEYATIYIAAVDASKAPTRAGASYEIEQTRPIRVRIDDALDALGRGAIHNGYLIIALQWIALNRDRLPELLREP